MRIISGSFKGKKIFEPRDNITRPLKDLAKESIFNIIEHSNKFNTHIIDSNILDLFSGVGSFGIECLSRGSKKVVFVENYSGVLPILKKNLSSLKIVEKYEILENDIYNDKILSKLNDKFDIIFLDPPFKDKNLNKFLLKLKNFEILNKNGVIIIHRHKDEDDKFSEKFKIVDEKKYGISKISFLTNLN
tara:strand:- start:142 stop:708 length:567 start_codon:yes stop_codon:yes gene_type:complete